MKWPTGKELRDVLLAGWRAIVAALLALLVGNGGLEAPQVVVNVPEGSSVSK